MTNLIDRDAALAKVTAHSDGARKKMAAFWEDQDGDNYDAWSSIVSHLDVVADTLRALPAVEVGVKWEHIQTAPRGGEWFIARTARGTTRVVHYADEYDRYPISHDSTIWETAPSEWTPLNAALSAITVTPAPDAEMAVLQAAGEEYVLEHPIETAEERLGRHSAIRGMMVRLGVYGKLEAAIDAALAAMKEDFPNGI